VPSPWVLIALAEINLSVAKEKKPFESIELKGILDVFLKLF